MNKTQFINELKHRLQRLPADEYQSAIMYYEEYFEDAGPEHEQDVIMSLGSPATVAAVLIGEFAMKMPPGGEQPTAKKSMNTIWVALLAVFASPIALPLALAFGVIIMALGIVVFSVLFSFGITSFTLLLSGVVCAAVSIICIPQGAAAALLTLGMSLMVVSFGILFSLGTVALFRVTFKGIANLVGSFLVKSNRKKMAKQQQRYQQQQYQQQQQPQQGQTYYQPNQQTYYQPQAQQPIPPVPMYTNAPQQSPPQYTNRPVNKEEKQEVIPELQQIVDLTANIGDNITANVNIGTNTTTDKEDK